jgi:hypothetical protein
MRNVSAILIYVGLSLLSTSASADPPFPRAGSAKLAAYSVCRSLGVIDMGTLGSQTSADCVGIVKNKEAANRATNSS